ncbi:hypothetical protein NEIELOOT_00487 [Neisseria elongata subsp. glycolytica ATCC 29315]|uniref:Uncharacterized protein n=1 Tax=Neisseria elongata subsp. glycolytica ATCC 29315 TaxID=546263 RepID=D4DN63_NEIEG|nr:hypothetical protein NEIELOOT_00487 [Neisseria elongata subsp. glycolytica ATCC 29315]
MNERLSTILSFAAMICLFAVKAIECARLPYGRFFQTACLLVKLLYLGCQCPSK